MAVQNINNFRRGRQQGAVVKLGTKQYVGGGNVPSAGQILQQAKQNVDRNLQVMNPVSMGGAYLYTSQYSDEALADARERAKKGDVISQLYVSTAEGLLKNIDDTMTNAQESGSPVVKFTSGVISQLPYTIAQVPAYLQGVNLIQSGESGIIKKGYESVPGIITDTIDYAKGNPVQFAGALVGGAVLGGAGIGAKAGSVGKAAKSAGKVKTERTVADIANVGYEKGAKRGFRDSTLTPTPKGYDKVNSRPDKTTTETKLVTQLPRSAFGSSPASTPSGNQRQFLTQTRTKSSPTPQPIRTTPTNSPSTRTQQRVSIVGNVPSEFRGNIGQGYAADVKIKGNTFVLTPVDTRITLNTPSPSTLRPVSFDDILQNVIKGSGIAVKTSDRRGTVTNTMQRMPVGVTLEAGGARARFPDYSPNIYRAVSSEDYFASAIGGRSRGNDIYTYPFRDNSDVRSTPRTIEAINSNSLFRLLDKTLNPAPMKPQNLDAFKGNPRVKEIELVEVGQTSSPRELPANVQPLKISKITEYVTEYQKISFQGQKSKTGVKYQAADVASKTPKTQSRLRVTRAVKTTQKSLSKSAESSAVLSIPTNTAINAFAAVSTATVNVNAKVTSLPTVVPPIPSDTDFSSTLSGDSSTSTSKTGDVDASKVTDKSTSNDSDISRVNDSDAAITTRRRQGDVRSSRKRGRTLVRKDTDKDTDSRRIRRRDVDTTKTRRIRKRKDTEPEEEEEKKKKKVRKTTSRSYIQKTNPLPWEADAEDTSWLRKDMSFMRMPARVKVTEVRPKLEAYNEKVKAFNAARKKLRNTATQATAEGRKALTTLKRLYKAAFEAREGVVKAIEKNRR